MNKIDDILQRLQAAEQPAIDNADELTERIMKETHPLTPPVREGRRLRAAFERSKALPLTGERGEGLTPSLARLEETLDPSRTGRAGGESWRAGGESSFLLIIRTVLSLAALWIIGFFIYLQFESVAPTEAMALPPTGGKATGRRAPLGRSTFGFPLTRLPVAFRFDTSKNAGRGAGASTLKDIYKDYFCQDCKKTISYTQIRNKLYENK